MSERPILMSGPMVRAILAGTKTQTRRAVTPSRSLVDGTGYRAWPHLDFDGSKWVDAGPSPAGNPGPYLKVANIDGERRHRVYSRIQVGNTLWVKETWAPDPEPGDLGLTGYTWYRATHEEVLPQPERWRPSIHMPRWASRINLRVTSVRVERVQDISEEDAVAEGVKPLGPAFRALYGATPENVGHVYPAPAADVMAGGESWTTSAARSFRGLWVSINGAESWESNPFVWVVGFERVNEMVDEMTKAQRAQEEA